MKLKNLFLKLIRFYQKIFSSDGWPSCRFRPTCSEYTYQAINRYGIITGGVKGFKRILRCHPFTKGGYDPLK